MAHITLWLFLILLLIVVMIIPYKMSKATEMFQAACDCDNLNNQVNKLQGDVLNYQQRAADGTQKCENDKIQIQTQFSSERTKLTTDSANAKADQAEKDQKILLLKIDVDKCEKSRRSVIDENEKLRLDYKAMLQALTTTIDFAQTCQVSTEKQRATLADSTVLLANSSSHLANVSNRTTDLINRYVNECYRYNSPSGLMYSNEREKEKKDVIDKLTPLVGAETIRESDIIAASSNGKHKILKTMTPEAINKLIGDITADPQLQEYEKRKLSDAVQKVVPLK